MAAFVTTLVVLLAMLLTIRALLRHSRFAVGVTAGAVIAVAVWAAVKAALRMEEIPIWLPAVPFALVAAMLFGFGLLAWFWSED